MPIRKAGKLPGETLRAEYDLEYGTATLEVAGKRSRPATGCCSSTTCWQRVAPLAGPPRWSNLRAASRSALSVLLELTFLGGRDRVAPLPVHALLLD